MKSLAILLVTWFLFSVMIGLVKLTIESYLKKYQSDVE